MNKPLLGVGNRTIFGRNKQMTINRAIDYIESEHTKQFNSMILDKVHNADMLYFY